MTIGHASFGESVNYKNALTYMNEELVTKHQAAFSIQIH